MIREGKTKGVGRTEEGRGREESYPIRYGHITSLNVGKKTPQRNRAV